MCGRFAFYSAKDKVEAHFDISITHELSPQYNITPSHLIPVIYTPNHDKTFDYFTWGFLPNFIHDKRKAQINARFETVHEKPLFKHAFKSQRCIVVADGWYEWQKKGENKKPFYFTHKKSALLPFAGIWSSGVVENKTIQSVAILTRPADEPFKAIHPRMPLILTQAHIETWLSHTPFSYIREETAFSFEATDIKAYAVSDYVNSPIHQDKRCIEKLS